MRLLILRILKRFRFPLALILIAGAILVASVMVLSSREPNSESVAQILQSSSVTLAVLVGGIWAFYRYVVQRAYETALNIDVSSQSTPFGDSSYMVDFDVAVTNIGNTRVGAKSKRSAGADFEPAYQDRRETLRHSVGLKIRQVVGLPPKFTEFRWLAFEDSKRSPESQIVQHLEPACEEIDLIDIYETLDRKKPKTEFWIEPGKTYHLNAIVVLPAGSYLGVVTFIGDQGDHEFWRRQFLVHVPAPSDTKHAQVDSPKHTDSAESATT